MAAALARSVRAARSSAAATSSILKFITQTASISNRGFSSNPNQIRPPAIPQPVSPQPNENPNQEAVEFRSGSPYIGDSLSKREREKHLIEMLMELEDSKEAVYGSLDAWVAWEQEFPIAMLKKALLVLEEQEQWHRIIQVIKWMLGKGQGTTLRTYEQLIKAFDKDNRPQEAHRFWTKRIACDLQSVSWDMCKLMISIYHRHNMPQDLMKLFKRLESYDRKPPGKSVVEKVANAYEMLGRLDEKDKILEKYNHLFMDIRSRSNKSREESSKMKTTAGILSSFITQISSVDL